ncbi:murein DD-endopeptidase MepM [Ursidibacter maritimus]|uniref:Murein DD-endopeptidase MepM n=2 Tax=Ursidibacter maritimus TaxID=1331689 RepID=A0A949WLF3_9PAST|nr:murein DD-endopeptidase MepM [Ursidibacter maritimus]MBV6523820.1 murein DD-endopeptidase MepM [Ursidibacter maritimus]MBV6526095.1 murein DD-endopeptidase MepM [Ursidibacter maritimus]MBV6527135.1 murein DD-endopeptidase MepM [Ursidibacter maritimus]MBV6529030.1 murein DD-endopeptidase MepM [Ursidibacter maritimus]MBV6531023.1 murein DD-endopeptidase MepM [Ursidibacter maritimus]
MFLAAMASIFIGIVLMLKQQEIPNNPSSVNVVTSENNGQSIIEPQNTLVAESSTAEEKPNSADASLEKPNVTSALEHISHSTIMANEELTYIDIQDGEFDEPESNETTDENATSYEDDFIAQDDIDDETIERIQNEAAQKNAQQEKLDPEAESALDSFLDVADEALRIQNQFSYTVARGDKLADVLEQSGLSANTAKVLEKKFPQLANLSTGQQFYWVLDKDGELEYMNWLVSEKEEKIFERKSKNQFSVQTIQKEGVWKQDVVKGTLNGDFTSSLKAQGLSNRQINQLAAGLQWQIATNKLKKGDKFVILLKREYINGKVTELGNVEAIRVVSGKKSYYAIQADNGRYYSLHGETLGRGFSRYPLQFTPRVSSPFNPRRLHPVTRRVAPHKGVDFGLPVGTPIIAPADGVVEHVAYQANGAGRYIKLRHGGQYTTVYMHLSRQLVRPGQTVKKGERIGLSGNTGRSTGPHLHYEFHINGRPVNPMTVKLPGTGSGMPEKERKAFLVKARKIEAQLKL